MDPRGVLVYADLSCHKNANPPLKWGTDPQIFVTTKRHAKRIGGPKYAMPRRNRGRSNRKEEVYGDLSCQKSQKAYETGGAAGEKKKV